MKKKETMVLTTLMIPPALKRQVEAVAGKDAISFGAFMRRAAQQYLDGRPVYGGTPAEVEQTARLIRRYITREARKLAKSKTTGKGAHG